MLLSSIIVVGIIVFGGGGGGGGRNVNGEHDYFTKIGQQFCRFSPLTRSIWQNQYGFSYVYFHPWSKVLQASHILHHFMDDDLYEWREIQSNFISTVLYLPHHSMELSLSVNLPQIQGELGNANETFVLTHSVYFWDYLEIFYKDGVKPAKFSNNPCHLMGCISNRRHVLRAYRFGLCRSVPRKVGWNFVLNEPCYHYWGHNTSILFSWYNKTLEKSQHKSLAGMVESKLLKKRDLFEKKSSIIMKDFGDGDEDDNSQLWSMDYFQMNATCRPPYYRYVPIRNVRLNRDCLDPENREKIRPVINTLLPKHFSEKSEGGLFRAFLYYRKQDLVVWIENQPFSYRYQTGIRDPNGDYTNAWKDATASVPRDIVHRYYFIGGFTFPRFNIDIDEPEVPYFGLLERNFTSTTSPIYRKALTLAPKLVLDPRVYTLEEIVRINCSQLTPTPSNQMESVQFNAHIIIGTLLLFSVIFLMSITVISTQFGPMDSPSKMDTTLTATGGGGGSVNATKKESVQQSQSVILSKLYKHKK